jgi:hypothetical protein
VSYPRNAASPPIYDVGSLVQISDGALQTSGASARVKIGSGAWGAAAGSLDCDATSGIWTYVPSQAETDAESFILAVYKTGCVSISRTIVPSASVTAGKTVLSAETHTGAVIPTVSAVTGLVAANLDATVSSRLSAAGYTAPANSTIADISTRLPAALESGRIAAALDSATAAQVDNIENASGYLLAVLAGACADPQTASETYSITVFGSTFTVDLAGQTSTGTRTAPTLNKT